MFELQCQTVLNHTYMTGVWLYSDRVTTHRFESNASRPQRDTLPIQYVWTDIGDLWTVCRPSKSVQEVLFPVIMRKFTKSTVRQTTATIESSVWDFVLIHCPTPVALDVATYLVTRLPMKLLHAAIPVNSYTHLLPFTHARTHTSSSSPTDPIKLQWNVLFFSLIHMKLRVDKNKLCLLAG